jgi:hypothetical protein
MASGFTVEDAAEYRHAGAVMAFDEETVEQVLSRVEAWHRQRLSMGVV